MDLGKGIGILCRRLSQQGVGPTFWWAADHAVRVFAGANVRRLSRVTPQLYVGGQYRRRGWPRMRSWGITAVVNLRNEYDDRQKGIAPPRYLHLPTPDDAAPSLEDLRAGAEFIAQEVARGGAVYVHCGSGIGRAPTLAAAYLVSTGRSAEEAWAGIRAVRPYIRPTPPQVAQIERFAVDAQAAREARPVGEGHRAKGPNRYHYERKRYDV